MHNHRRVDIPLISIINMKWLYFLRGSVEHFLARLRNLARLLKFTCYSEYSCCCSTHLTNIFSHLFISSKDFNNSLKSNPFSWTKIFSAFSIPVLRQLIINVMICERGKGHRITAELFIVYILMCLWKHNLVIYIYIYIYTHTHTHTRGTYDKFPDFFRMGILKCRRLLKIQYVIAIHHIRWLTNFYDFVRSQSSKIDTIFRIIIPELLLKDSNVIGN